MKMPINCPVCGRILLNKYEENVSKSTRLTKVCNKKLDHDIHLKSTESDHNTVAIIETTYDLGMSATWYCNLKTLVLRGKTPELRLPFFEPDFTNYPKLMEKLKTYVIFS